MAECEGSSLGVGEELVKGSLEALKKLVTIEREKRQTDLLADLVDQPVCLVFWLAVPSQGRIRPFPIKIPHSFYDKGAVCLIVQDPKDPWKAAMDAARIPAVTKMVTVGKLRKMKQDVKWKQQLAAQYDLFLADARAAHMLPEILGCHFVDKKKFPVELRLTTAEKSTERVREALACTYLRLPRGTEFRVLIGKTDMEVADLAANARSVLDRLDKFFAKPGGKHSNKILRVCVETAAVTRMPPIPIYYHPDQKKMFLTPDFGKTPTAHVSQKRQKSAAGHSATKKQRKKPQSEADLS